MLKHLIIRDFVIVDTLELDFSSGFTALTGETGAGKSILIDALSLALGERVDAGMVRTGCEKADISAEFDIAGLPQLQSWLREQELEGDEGVCKADGKHSSPCLWRGLSFFDNRFRRDDLGQLAAAVKQGAKQPSTPR